MSEILIPYLLLFLFEILHFVRNLLSESLKFEIQVSEIFGF